MACADVIVFISPVLVLKKETHKITFPTGRLYYYFLYRRAAQPTLLRL